MRRVLCRTSMPLITMPICAARPLPTMSAVGVASPRAHGHAMMRTATAAVKAFSTSPSRMSHAAKVAALIAKTTGTKIEATLSATFCTGAFVACASRTNLAMRAKVVSPPTRVARTSNRPFWFTVADVTLSPTATSTGTLSPVIMLASMLDVPSSTTPSAAIFSPGRTTRMSPSRTTDAGIETSSPSRNTVAYFAPIARSDRNASPAEFFARISR
ncbi:unannotated protein [freshwater metagenome]|uniref:Unannotated protein n=1 Tax=freshwater metagenome TaxID=449393 RepID=A0A6J6P1M2_9ZZZZ